MELSYAQIEWHIQAHSRVRGRPRLPIIGFAAGACLSLVLWAGLVVGVWALLG